MTAASLLRQWQFELKSKFNETFSIINSETVRYLRQSQGFTGNPFEIHDNVIASSSWIASEERARQVGEVSWDMVIVDETHHAQVHISGRKREETRSAAMQNLAVGLETAVRSPLGSIICGMVQRVPLCSQNRRRRLRRRTVRWRTRCLDVPSPVTGVGASTVSAACRFQPRTVWGIA